VTSSGLKFELHGPFSAVRVPPSVQAPSQGGSGSRCGSFAFFVFHLPFIFLIGIGVGAFMLIVFAPNSQRGRGD
jgi:hypothetical protein